MRRFLLYFLGLTTCSHSVLTAQRVSYTEPVLAKSGTTYQVIGKSSDYCWIEKNQTKKKPGTESNPSEIQSLLLYDPYMQPLEELILPFRSGLVKQWLVPGGDRLDQIEICSVQNKNYITRKSYSIFKQSDGFTKILDSFSFHISPSQLILCRSADKSKILLLIFENTESETTGLHAFLFDKEWNMIYRKSFSQIHFALPFIQDDDYLITENFDDLPVKVSNSGDWLMAFPSRENLNYSLLHVRPNGIDYSIRDIKRFSVYKLEDVAMYFDEDQLVTGIGFLSGYPGTSLKHVKTCIYSVRDDRFVFDTAYHFNTQADDFKNKNLSHERFMSVPGNGYLYLKEYGEPFEFQNHTPVASNNWDASFLLASYQNNAADLQQIKSGYSYNRGFKAIPEILHTGDLNLFYFPSISKDSVWSGILETEQHSNTNFPMLSYLVLPFQRKIDVLYNALDRNPEPFVSTTLVNLKGQETGAGLVFWKTDRLLDFQHYRQIAKNEIAIPYHEGRRTGYAFIRIDDD